MSGHTLHRRHPEPDVGGSTGEVDVSGDHDDASLRDRARGGEMDCVHPTERVRVREASGRPRRVLVDVKRRDRRPGGVE